MSAAKLMKGIVRRLLNTSDHNNSKDSTTIDNRHDDDVDSCWRRNRRSKHFKKSIGESCIKSGFLPDIVPVEHDHCCKVVLDDDPIKRPPDPVCVCEDCYLALICRQQHVEVRCNFCHIQVSPRRKKKEETKRMMFSSPQQFSPKEHKQLQRISTDHHPTDITMLNLGDTFNLPPSICLSKDGEEPYQAKPNGILIRSDKPFGSIVPPNRTICHIVTS